MKKINIALWITGAVFLLVPIMIAMGGYAFSKRASGVFIFISFTCILSTFLIRTIERREEFDETQLKTRIAIMLAMFAYLVYDLIRHLK